MQEYFIGLMSGTSLDGADGVLVNFSSQAPRVMAAASEPFSDAFRTELLALNTPSLNELHRSALAAHQLATVYARVVQALLRNAAAIEDKLATLVLEGANLREVSGAVCELTGKPSAVLDALMEKERPTTDDIVARSERGHQQQPPPPHAQLPFFQSNEQEHAAAFGSS